MAKIQFDYESIKQRILRNLSIKSEWSEFLSYGVIDNIVSDLVQEMAYEVQYSEYNSFENYWNLARNKSSLLQLAPMHGYIVPRKRSAIGTLEISTSENFDTAYDKEISIKKFFQFSGNNIYVCSSDDNTLLPSQTSTTIIAKQGEVKYVKFSAEGNNYETKTILDDSVDNDLFELRVNGVVWNCVDSLFLYGENDQVYHIKTLPNFKGIELCFGNGIFGKKLNQNDYVEFTYISTLGEDGNIFSNGLIDTVESQAYDSSGNAIKLYVRNITSFNGGKNYPSIEEIRELSPKIYQTGQRASSVEDYTTILKNINYITKVLVWGVYEELIEKKIDPWLTDNNYDEVYIKPQDNVVHLALLNDAYEELTHDEKTETVQLIYNKCDPTDIIKFETPIIIPLLFKIDAKIKSTAYNLSDVKSNILNTLNDNYNIKYMDFGKNIYNSDFVRLIDEVDGVDNHNSQILMIYDNLKFKSPYECNVTLPIHPIKYSTVKIYIKKQSDENYIEMAECDINGNIIGIGDFITSSSYVNSIEGTVKLTVTSGLTENYTHYDLKIIYGSIEDDLKVNYKTEIFKYQESNITLKYN